MPPPNITPKPSPAVLFCTSANEDHVALSVDDADDPVTVMGLFPSARTHAAREVICRGNRFDSRCQ